MDSELVLILLAAVGGSGVLVLGLGAWLGKVWAARIRDSDKARLEEQLARLRSDLDITRSQQHRTSEARFGLYGQVWVFLQDVKILGDRLWERADRETLDKYRLALEEARAAINKGRLILREDHYRRLSELLNTFERFRVGKKRLIDIRTREELEQNFGFEDEIREQIRRNGELRDQYDRLLNEIVDHFRRQLGLA
jgi:hypothetical protein